MKSTQKAVNMSSHDVIIVKKDLKDTPVVFIADTINTKSKTIMAAQVTDGKLEAPENVSLAYYTATRGMTEEDEQAIADIYKESFGAKEVFVRKRLPRNYMSANTPKMVPKGFSGNDKDYKGKERRQQRNKIDREEISQIVARAVVSALRDVR